MLAYALDAARSATSPELHGDSVRGATHHFVRERLGRGIRHGHSVSHDLDVAHGEQTRLLEQILDFDRFDAGKFSSAIGERDIRQREASKARDRDS